nr:sn1-specific diacylglycerol lipase beta isoform X1 [Ipomoea batatas]
MEAIYICIFQRRQKRLIVNGSNPNSNQESDSRLGFLEHDHCPGNLRRDGGGGQSCRHCGHLRHRSLALEFALESSRRAFALTILSPNSNSHPNIRQDKFKATYFIVVLPHLKTVVIAVHGTETPKDLITVGLCRECNLSEGDLDGLVNKVCLLALPVRAGNMGVVLHSLCWIMAKALSVDPFCTNTSLSFQMGIEWTLYLFQRSEKRGALISILRTPSGTSSESWKHGGCTSFSVLDNGKGIETWVWSEIGQEVPSGNTTKSEGKHSPRPITLFTTSP